MAEQDVTSSGDASDQTTSAHLDKGLDGLKPDNLLRDLYAIHDALVLHGGRERDLHDESLWPLVYRCLDYCRSEIAAPAIWSGALTIAQDLAVAYAPRSAFSPDQLAYILLRVSTLESEYDTVYNIDANSLAIMEQQLGSFGASEAVVAIESFRRQADRAPRALDIRDTLTQLQALSTRLLIVLEVAGARRATGSRLEVATMAASGGLKLGSTLLLSLVDKIRIDDTPATFAHCLALLTSEKHLSYLAASAGDPRLFWFVVTSVTAVTADGGESDGDVRSLLKSLLLSLAGSAYIEACSDVRRSFLLTCIDWLDHGEEASRIVPGSTPLDTVLERLAQLLADSPSTEGELLPDATDSEVIELMLIGSRLPEGLERLLVRYADRNHLAVINPLAIVIRLACDWDGKRVVAPLLGHLVRTRSTTPTTILSAMIYGLRRLLDAGVWDGENAEPQNTTTTTILACLARNDTALRYETVRLMLSLDQHSATWEFLDYRQQHELVAAVRNLPRRVAARLAQEQGSVASLASGLEQPVALG